MNRGVNLHLYLHLLQKINYKIYQVEPNCQNFIKSAPYPYQLI